MAVDEKYNDENSREHMRKIKTVVQTLTNLVGGQVE